MKTVKPTVNMQMAKGLKFGKLETIQIIGKYLGHSIWQCKCECGKLTTGRAGNLLRGEKRSCGCLRGEDHGARRDRNVRTPEYATWIAMKQRCLTPTYRDFFRYGGRGIKICERWVNSFCNFVADMGPRPEGYSIERINNDGNYEPSNCRWATAKEQAYNRRTNRYITIGNQTMTITEWADKNGLNKATVHSRLRRGVRGEAIVGPLLYRKSKSV